MRAKLIALLIGLGSALINGVNYRFVVPASGVRLSRLQDAGIAALCSPILLECQVRAADACRTLADGGMSAKYRTVETPVYQCADFVDPVVIVVESTWADDAGIEHPCYEPAGPINEACVVTDWCSDGGTACNGQAHFNADRCACWAGAGVGPCKVPNPDGGANIQIPQGVTVNPPWGGTGCVRKSCNELNGDQGQSWPASCPP